MKQGFKTHRRMRRLNMESPTSANETSYQDEINASYEEIVKVFGKPNGIADGYKTDVEWIGEFYGKVFTIYNWKDGKNYNGDTGLEIEEITEWHIGSLRKETAIVVKNFFNRETGRVS